MIETLFVLFLIIGREPIEWTPHATLSECLSVKRKIERNVGRQASNRYACKERTVKLNEDYIITKFITEDGNEYKEGK